MKPNESSRRSHFFGRRLTFRQLSTFGRSRSGIAILTALLGGIVLLASAAAFSDDAEEEPLAEHVLPVATMTLTRSTSYDAPRWYTGSVRARRRTNMSFNLPGQIRAIEVDEGDRVAKGTPLATLRTHRLEARQMRLEAQRDEAKARLAELVFGPRKETIAAARAELRDLEAQYKLQKAHFDRHEKLFGDGVITEEEFDTTRFGVEGAAARVDVAQRRLDELEAGTRQEQIDAQRAVVEQLEAQILDLKIDLHDSTLEAPMDGTIAARYVDEAMVVDAGTPIVTLVEDGALEAWIGVPAGIALSLEPGDTKPIVVEGETFEARVTGRLPELDSATRTRTVVFQFEPAAAARIVPEQVARVQLSRRVEAEGFWVPTVALTAGPRGLWDVYTIVDGRAERRHVELLFTEGDRVLVRGTLREGETIISDGAHRIVSGQSVKTLRTARSSG